MSSIEAPRREGLYPGYFSPDTLTFRGETAQALARNAFFFTKQTSKTHPDCRVPFKLTLSTLPRLNIP